MCLQKWLKYVWKRGYYVVFSPRVYSNSNHLLATAARSAPQLTTAQVCHRYSLSLIASNGIDCCWLLQVYKYLQYIMFHTIKWYSGWDTKIKCEEQWSPKKRAGKKHCPPSICPHTGTELTECLEWWIACRKFIPTHFLLHRYINAHELLAFWKSDVFGWAKVSTLYFLKMYI